MSQLNSFRGSCEYRLLTVCGSAVTIGFMPSTIHAGQSMPSRPVAAARVSQGEDSLAPFNPALLLVGFTAAVILAGTILLWLPLSASGGRASLLDALFTSASAATTTGLTIQNTAGFWSYTGQNVIMWLMLIGGAGSLIASTMLLLLIARRVTTEDRFLLKEFTGVQGARGMILLMLGVVVYALLAQLLGSFLLSRELSASMPPEQASWFGRFHAASAFNNAGFDLMGMDRNMPSTLVQLTLTGLTILGGLGFIVFLDLPRGIFRRSLALDTKMVLAGTAALILVGMVAILATESSNSQTLGPLALPQKVVSALFHSVSARTSGMATANLGLFVNATLLLIIALMFIGGASGSTAGGIKVNTFVLLLGVTRSFIRGKAHPSLFGVKIGEEHVNRALAIAFLSALLIFAVTMALSMTEGTEGQSLLPLLFETVSAFSTTGLSMGITSNLTAAGKLLIVFVMFAGKVGPVTLAFALSQRQRPSYHAYAEEAVNLG